MQCARAEVRGLLQAVLTLWTKALTKLHRGNEIGGYKLYLHKQIGEVPRRTCSAQIALVSPPLAIPGTTTLGWTKGAPVPHIFKENAEII